MGRIAAIVAAFMALAVATWIPTAVSESAALTSGAFELVVDQPVVQVQRESGAIVQPVLGVLVTGRQHSLVIQTTRSSYRAKWRSTLSIHNASGRRVSARTLPSGSFTSSGIREMGTAVMRAGNSVIASGRVGWCPSQVGHEPVAVDAATGPVYPTSCATHVFSMARVNGLERGWGSALWTSLSIPPNAPDGQYTVDVAIDSAWAKRFGMTTGGRSARVVLEVVTGAGQTPSGNTALALLDHGHVDPQTMEVHALPAPAVVKPPKDVLPDLAALPAYWIRTRHTTEGRDELTFAANTWNRGPAPLVVEGFRIEGTDLMDAQQILMRGDEAVGSHAIADMLYHRAPGHFHWHFSDFTRYELTNTRKRVVATSGKQSWCIAPTDAIDLTVKNAAYRPSATGLVSACGNESSEWIRQVLPVGWGDTYYQFAAGQAIDVTALPNGRYYLKVTVNPDGTLLEAKTSNNASYRLVILGGTPGNRTVSVPAYQGINSG